MALLPTHPAIYQAIDDLRAENKALKARIEDFRLKVQPVLVALHALNPHDRPNIDRIQAALDDLTKG